MVMDDLKQSENLTFFFQNFRNSVKVFRSDSNLDRHEILIKNTIFAEVVFSHEMNSQKFVKITSL